MRWWGANAVNGVINIITKETHTTQGALVTATGGTVEGGSGYLQYGGKVGSGHYRLDLGGARDGRLQNAGMTAAAVQRRFGTGALRLDLAPSPTDRWQIQALASADSHYDSGVTLDLSAPDFSTTFSEFAPSRFVGGMAQWTRQADARRATSVRVFGLRSNGAGLQSRTVSGVTGIEVQRRLAAGRHDLVVDTDARRTFDGELVQAPGQSMSPAQHRGHQLGGFAQDDIALSRAVTSHADGRHEDQRHGPDGPGHRSERAHTESDGFLGLATPLRRSVHATLRWQF